MAGQEGDQPGTKDSRPEAESGGDQRTGPLDETEKKPDAPQWRNLSSSNLVGYIYDKETKELEIEFHGGRFYTYRGVDQDTADGLGTAGSAGNYFNTKIKRRFPFSHG